MDEITQLIGKAPTMEAYCNSLTARCPVSMRMDEFLETEVQNNHVWIHPPYGQERTAIHHYLTCKAKSPRKTSAIIILPTKGQGHAVPWAPLLDGMVLLRQYTKDDRIFEPAHDPTKRFGKTRITEVWWDPIIPDPPPLPATLHSVMNMGTIHDMLFRCIFNGHEILAIVDSGATDSFSTARVQDPNQQLDTKDATYVKCAGEQLLHSRGTTHGRVQVGAYLDTVRTNVVDQLLEGVDLVLGGTWLRQNKVKIDYAKMICTIRSHGKRITITPLIKGHGNDPEHRDVDRFMQVMQTAPPRPCEVMSAKRAVRALKHGADYMFVNLRHVGTDPSRETANSRTAGGTAQGTYLNTLQVGRQINNGHGRPRPLEDDHGHVTDPPVQDAHEPSPDNPTVTRIGLNMIQAHEQSAMGVHPTQTYTKRPSGSSQPVPVGIVTEQDKDGSLDENEVGRSRSPQTTLEPMQGLAAQRDIDALLAKYNSVFPAELPAGLPPDRGIGHTIRLEANAVPPFRRNRRTSPAEYEICERYLKELLDKQLIAPSTSPFGAPIMFVAKPKGGFRVVCDWRMLNKLTIKNRYPLPRIDETLDKLGGATVFSSLDLNSGYFQIRISEEDAHKTAFTTPLGHYEFKVLGQGLANSPATFQSVMNRVFAQHVNKFVVVYLDDIMIFSKDAVSHLEHLETVLKLLQENKFYAKMEKCSFNKPEVKFLGHIVGQYGLKVDDTKIEVVKQWPIPKDVSQVRQFLGLTNYFRKFIQGYSSLTAPLHALTQKGVQFEKAWTPLHTEIIETLRTALITAPVLALPDYTQPFEIVSDASLLGTGALLMQNKRVIAYTSSKFSPAEKNYTTGEQELLGVIKAMQEWRCYVEGAESVLVTDHNPLTFLQTQPSLSRRQARWMEYLARFHYTWEYRPGRLNVADPISRNPKLATLNLLTLCLATKGRAKKAISMMDRIATGYQHDALFRDPANLQKYTLEGKYWMSEGRIVVPDVDTLRHDLLTEMHAPTYSGHVGTHRTLHAIQRTFTWKGIHAAVKDFVTKCHECQRNKSSNQRPVGKLQSVEIPERMWECISMDLITHLPVSQTGLDAIIVFVDKLSKMVRLAAVPTTVSAEGVAKCFVDNVFRSHGLPTKIVSDRDARFTGNFMTEVTRILQIRQAMSTSFHPQTDGQTERTNRTLEDMLRHYVNPYQNDWDEFLPVVEFAVNNSWQASVQNTPFFLNYGQHPFTPIMVEASKEIRVPAAQNFVQKHADRLTHAKACLQAAQDRQQAYANKTRRDVKEFRVGDDVLLSTKNLKFKNKGSTPKFMPKYIGPFKVTKLVGPRKAGTEIVTVTTALQLELPPLMRVHNVFHVSMVKPYKSDGTVHPPEPLDYEDDGTPQWEVEDLIGDRTRKHVSGKKQVTEYLVRWARFGPEQDTWEPSTEIHKDLIAAYRLRTAAQPSRPVSTRKRGRFPSEKGGV